jgi:heptosyltransferase III
MRGNKLFKLLDTYLGTFLCLALALFIKRRHKLDIKSVHFKNILVVKLAALGDAVLMIPALRSIRERFPDAKITVLSTKLTEQFLKMFPEYVDDFILLDVESILRHPTYFLKTIVSLKDKRFEVTIDFEQWSHITPIFVALANIPTRLGFKTKKQYRHFLFTHNIQRRIDIHEIQNFIGLTELVGTEHASTELEIKIDDEAVKRVRLQLTNGGWNQKSPIIVLHPGCGSHGFPREWPPASYAELASLIHKDMPSFFIITGTKEELGVMNEFKRWYSYQALHYQIDDLEIFIALLSVTSLFISGNNGAMHLAAASKTHQIALHGPTNHKQWGPLNPKATVIQSACPKCPCLDLGFEYHRKDGYCMEQIGIGEVHKAFIEIAKRSGWLK